MKELLGCLFVVGLSIQVYASQPAGVQLNANGVSYIYPVLDTNDWVLTQPRADRMGVFPDSTRVTHWGDEYYAQDWARGCGFTYGHRLYAGISGQVIMAGNRGPYGYTIVIYDSAAGFALKYSHLSELLVSVGEYVLAGKSLVGRVGNTGNVQGSACTSNPGAHLHLALFKNVVNVNGRPVATTSATIGSGPSGHAARFAYSTNVDVVKNSNDPTVYVLRQGVLWPVSAASFISHGWAFDKHQSIFNPLAGRVYYDGSLNYVPQSGLFWAPRDNALVQGSGGPTVYQFEDGRIQALTYNVFTCRGLRFNEVLQIPAGERPRYGPSQDVVSNTCGSSVRQALADWLKFTQISGGFRDPDLSQYAYHVDWDPNWHLRSLPFKQGSGNWVTLFLITHVNDAHNRQIGYTNPQTNTWSGWQVVP